VSAVRGPQRFVPLLRRTVLALCAAGALYLIVRFDVTALPAEGCSPLADVPPGARILCDTRWPALWPADAVLYRPPGQPLLLGRVVSTGDAGVWIEADETDCPSADSRTLGPIAAESVRARVLFVWAAD